ncbi:response regulator [Lichenihabitans sp. Uapishka_5]|uniref:response regulator n=1 Tax=Lichenihabitans sp. Uapishka_5 TaxID=3037302 RepID=UPI0029E7CE30|nr:response regulator [Lichenihabitans sp. Uapishka_5]MDX7951847.1 response regulator [Lichenihabitans sp. Uapishka_5]
MGARVIAVVDDEPSVRSATASLLRSMGYACVTFGGARDLVETTFQGLDCVCSDIQMPGMSGMDLAEHCASHPGAPPLLLMTAYYDEHVASACRKLGVCAVLEKPLDADLLMEAIERALLA